ncbi:putative protein PTGES3L [Hypanus sabinus]|uniref:putative protein PTGES3L n=1 Tax=Hypanus sabinus TaxID=79690 RepID=UPI0028C46A8E|nr:putative protein PTGES3L [Hypanus sabinus]
MRLQVLDDTTVGNVHGQSEENSLAIEECIGCLKLRDHNQPAGQPAKTQWYDRKNYVFVEFCVEDSKDVYVKIEKLRLIFSCRTADNTKLYNNIELYSQVEPNDSRHKRSDRSITLFMRKIEGKKAWPRLTKDKTKHAWLVVDFDNWRDWHDDDEQMIDLEHYANMLKDLKDTGAPPTMDDLDD